MKKQIVAMLLTVVLALGLAVPSYADESMNSPLVEEQAPPEEQASQEEQAPPEEQASQEEQVPKEEQVSQEEQVPQDNQDKQTEDMQTLETPPILNYGDWMGYENEDGTLTVVGIHTLSANLKDPVVIPSIIEGKTVTAIDGVYKKGHTVFDAFSPELVTRIVFPDTVVEFKGYSNILENFVNLHTIAFPNNDEIDLDRDVMLELPSLRNISVHGGTTGPTSESSNAGESTSPVETITVYEGSKFAWGGRFDKLTTLNLPSTIERFNWSESPILSKVNCPKSTELFNTVGIRDCPNLKIPVRTVANEHWGYIESFENSGITKISIDGLYGSFNKRTFRDCPNLKEINVTNGKDYYSKDGVLYWKDDLIAYPAEKSTATNYTLPSNIKCIYASMHLHFQEQNSHPLRYLRI